MISFTDQFCEQDRPMPDTTEPAAPTSTAIVTMTGAALAPLQAIEQGLRALAERYRDVAYDLKTPKGLAAMKAARHDLRENGRYLVQRAVQKCKDDANAAKKAVEQEAVRLVAITETRETEFDKAILARESELAAEKAERDRLEAERIAKHRAGIETIRGYVAQAQGRSAADLAGALHTLTGLSRGLDGKAWDEFAQEAADAWAATIGAVERMCSEAIAREHEAARIEAQRIEQARVAAEQAERQRQLDEQSAAIQRQADELAAERAAAALAQSAAAAAATLAQMAAAPIVLATTPNPLIERHVVIADDALSDPALLAGSTIVLDDGEEFDPPARVTGEAPLAAVEPVPMINLGQIVERLGLIISAEMLDKMGFPATRDRTSRLYRASDFPAICDAIAEHALAIGRKYQQ